MRTALLSFSVAAFLAVAPLSGAEPTCSCQASSGGTSCNIQDKSSSACNSAGCDCQAKHHRCHGHGCKCRSRYEGLDRTFNCRCNGSYTYPVPPLYSYHWPGMYKQQRMTDYHSPWRYPAIKPYTDDPAFDAELETTESPLPEFLQPVAYDDSIRVNVRPRSSEPESMSSRFERAAR